MTNSDNTNSQLIIFLGPPGSGKGTQAQMIKQRLKCEYIATGDLVREIIKSEAYGEPLYEEVKKRYNDGIPQPDSIILQIVERKLGNINLSNGVIFDSFPLSIGQAYGLETLQTKFLLDAPRVIYVNIDKKNILQRLKKRKYCPQCNKTFFPGTNPYQQNKCDTCSATLSVRADDAPEVIERRYDEYTNRLQSVISYYQQKGVLNIIDGIGTVEEVANRIQRIFL